MFEVLGEIFYEHSVVGGVESWYRILDEIFIYFNFYIFYFIYILFFIYSSLAVCCYNNEIKYAVRVGGEMCICCLVRYFIGTALLVGM